MPLTSDKVVSSIMTNPRKSADLADFPVRFQKKVSIDRATGCWNWTGATKHPPGHPHQKYPVYTADATPESSTGGHQFAYQFVNGPILPGLRLDIDHICKNKLCVNPKHLRPLTHQDNCRLRSRRKRVPGSARWLREKYQRGEL